MKRIPPARWGFCALGTAARALPAVLAVVGTGRVVALFNRAFRARILRACGMADGH